MKKKMCLDGLEKILPTSRPKRKYHKTYNTCQRWEVIGGKKHYFRSNWEVDVAKELQLLKSNGIIADWLYEPVTFWFLKIKRGVRSYKPDFQVILPNGKHYWIEVKGWMDKRSHTKIARFRKYYPGEELRVIEKKDMLRIH